MITPPPVDQHQKAHEKAQKQLNQVKDELADLRDVMDLKPLETKNLSGAVGADAHAERSLITSKVGAGSGGITSAEHQPRLRHRCGLAHRPRHHRGQLRHRALRASTAARPTAGGGGGKAGALAPRRSS